MEGEPGIEEVGRSRARSSMVGKGSEPSRDCYHGGKEEGEGVAAKRGGAAWDWGREL